jgi:hypothetical protein
VACYFFQHLSGGSHLASSFTVSKKSGAERHSAVDHSGQSPCQNQSRSGGLSHSGEMANSLEPISKSPEEDDEAGELDKAEEVLSVVLPADKDATLPLYPGEEPLDEPASHVTA